MEPLVEIHDGSMTRMESYFIIHGTEKLGVGQDPGHTT